MDITINDLSFRAKLGKNILKKIDKEFNYDKTKLDKYVQLFKDTFESNLDKETVVDINRNRNFVFSNNNFPDIKYQHSSKMKISESVAKTLINECSRIFGGGEIDLFKVVIRKHLNNGKDTEGLKQLANKIHNPKSREYFDEYIKVAERIKKEFPDSKISREEFDYIQNIIMQEEANTPGTEMYKKVHNLIPQVFSFS